MLAIDTTSNRFERFIHSIQSIWICCRWLFLYRDLYLSISMMNVRHITSVEKCCRKLWLGRAVFAFISCFGCDWYDMTQVSSIKLSKISKAAPGMWQQIKICISNVQSTVYELGDLPFSVVWISPCFDSDQSKFRRDFVQSDSPSHSNANLERLKFRSLLQFRRYFSIDIVANGSSGFSLLKINQERAVFI